MAPSVLGLLVTTTQPIPVYLNNLLLPRLDATVSIEQLPEGQFLLVFNDNGVSLAHTGRKQPGDIRVDFTAGSANHRRQFGGGKGQMIAKAVGLKGSFTPAVLDLTAGLGQDAFVLASLGCSMTMVERNPIVHALLADGLHRGLQSTQHTELLDILQSMVLYFSSGVDFLAQLAEPVDVIYLDPMFPAREKSAKVKKTMQAFHHLVGEDNDAGLLLSKALERAKYRVVVKRPRIAPALHEQYPEHGLPSPNLVLTGKSGRFDIYPLAKMPTSK